MELNKKLIFSGFVEKKNVENYVQFREKYVNKCRNNTNFRRAVEEIDNYISDPQKYGSNAVARVIKIKTEKDIQQHLGIKIERKSVNPVKEATINATAEKNNLIAEIVALKSENQMCCFQLNEKKKELIANKEEADQKFLELNNQIATLTSKLKIAEAEAFQLKKDAAEKQAIDKQNFADLVREKKILIARINQLQSSAIVNSQNDQSDKRGSDANIFEVDKVLADKRIGRTRYFLIRWKGFSQADDTWEKEENLLDPTILKEYMQSKKK